MPGKDGFDASLCNCSVKACPRPDGTVLVSVIHEGNRIERVVDSSCSTAELVRLIKLDIASSAGEVGLAAIVQSYASKALPTYANQPIHRTRYSRLWEMRKLKGY